jgi:hypothetical protein
MKGINTGKKVYKNAILSLRAKMVKMVKIVLGFLDTIKSVSYRIIF